MKISKNILLFDDIFPLLEATAEDVDKIFGDFFNNNESFKMIMKYADADNFLSFVKIMEAKVKTYFIDSYNIDPKVNLKGASLIKLFSLVKNEIKNKQFSFNDVHDMYHNILYSMDFLYKAGFIFQNVKGKPSDSYFQSLSHTFNSLQKINDFSSYINSIKIVYSNKMDDFIKSLILRQTIKPTLVEKIDGTEYAFYYIKEQKECRILGGDTRWCTASSSGMEYYTTYIKRSNLYIIFINHLNKYHIAMVKESQEGTRFFEQFKELYEFCQNLKNNKFDEFIKTNIMKFYDEVYYNSKVNSLDILKKELENYKNQSFEEYLTTLQLLLEEFYNVLLKVNILTSPNKKGSFYINNLLNENIFKTPEFKKVVDVINKLDSYKETLILYQNELFETNHELQKSENELKNNLIMSIVSAILGKLSFYNSEKGKIFSLVFEFADPNNNSIWKERQTLLEEKYIEGIMSGLRKLEKNNEMALFVMDHILEIYKFFNEYNPESVKEYISKNESEYLKIIEEKIRPQAKKVSELIRHFMDSDLLKNYNFYIDHERFFSNFWTINLVSFDPIILFEMVMLYYKENLPQSDWEKLMKKIESDAIKIAEKHYKTFNLEITLDDEELFSSSNFIDEKIYKPYIQLPILKYMKMKKNTNEYDNIIMTLEKKYTK